MGQDQALGAVPFVPCQQLHPEGSDGGVPGSWGSLKAATDPRKVPPISLGPYGLCSCTLHWGQDSTGAIPRASALGYRRCQV